MLRTRLWMGSVLILLTVGVLLVDGNLAAWGYPFLFGLILILALLACHELLSLLGPARRPWPGLCYPAVVLLIVLNWLPHLCPWAETIAPDPLHWLLGAYIGIVLVAFVAAMAN